MRRPSAAPGSASSTPVTPDAVIAITPTMPSIDAGHVGGRTAAEGRPGRREAERRRPRTAGERDAGQDEAGQVFHL